MAAEPASIDAARGSATAIFVVGNSRSGTTIMARLLGAHSSVHVFHELHFFEELYDGTADAELDRQQARELAARLVNIERDDYIGERDIARYLPDADRLLETLDADKLTAVSVFAAFLENEAARHGAGIACEQTPRNVFYLQEILRAIPGARIVVMVRDPRAVLASQKHRWKIRAHGAKNFPMREVIRSWANYHPLMTALLWNSSIRAGDRSRGDARVKQVRFEEFVAAPEEQLDSVCRFAGIELQHDMLHLPRESGGVSSYKPDDDATVGVDPGAADRWRDGSLNAGELKLCQWCCRAGMAANGYAAQPVPTVAGWVGALAYLLVLPLQLIVTFALNVSRHKSLLTSIRRRLFP